jgi:hypothetical protein
MAYVFDPINNTLIDDEDKSLGNKFALMDSELEKAIRELNEKFGPDTVQQGTQGIPQPPIKTPQAIFEFEERMKGRMAEGGDVRQNLAFGALAYAPAAINVARPFVGPIVRKGAEVLGGTALGSRLGDIFFSKDKGDDKKEIIPSNNKTPSGDKPPEDPLENLITLTKAKDVFDTIDNLYKTGRSNEIPEYRTKEFANSIKNLVDTKYGGNISKLAGDLGIERVRINTLFKKYGIKALREGNKTMQTIFLEQDQDKLFLKNLTDEMKYDEQYLIDRIKKRYPNYEQDKKKYFNYKDLAEMTGLTFRTDNLTTLKTDQDDFKTRLRKTNKKFDLKTQPGFGKETKYQLEDFVKKFTKYNISKPVKGTGTYSSKLRKNFLLEQDSNLFRVKDSVTGEIRRVTKDTLGENFTPYALEQIGHGVSVNNQIAYKKLFKNSNVGIATEVLQDPVLNIDVLSGRNSTIKGYETSERKFYSILENLIGKKATDENIKIATDALNGLNKLREEAANDERLKTNFLKDQSNRVPKFELNLPEVGKKFKSGFLNVDMSDIDPSVSVGRILEINPDAKTFDDLSKEEQELYKENLKQQLADYAKYFYTEAKLDKDDVNDLFEALMEDDSIKMKKASGGGVEITPLPRANFSNGGAAGADVDFATELEYFFTNPDAELPVMQTYKETNNPIEILTDILNPRNYPYYADVLARSGLRIAEFGGKILPATGKLISDLIQKPAFKVKSTEDNYVRDYLDPPPPSNIKGTGIFSEFLENITPTTLEKKVGLASLIEKEEQRLKDTGSTVGPKVFADTLGLGAEVTAPIFPGLKLLRAYARKNNLPVNDVTQKLLVKEIDEVLEQRGMNRREFLQATGAGATVILAKLLGFGDEMARTAKVAEKVAEKTTGGGVPPYFFQLVEKIRRSGKQLEPEFDARVENNMQFENFVMKENMATGEISIQRTTEGGFNTGEDVIEGTISDELITYKPGENVLGKDGKYYRTADEYEEVTAKPDNEGKMKDIEPGLDSIEEIIELLPNKLKMSELEAAGYNVDAFSDKIKQLLIDDLPDLP